MHAYKGLKARPSGCEEASEIWCVDFGDAGLRRNAAGGFDQEGQDDKEEEIRRRDDRRDKGDGITEEAIDGLLNDDVEVNGQAKSPQPFRSSKAN